MKKTASFQHDSIQAHRFGFSLLGKPKMFVHTYFIDGLLIDTGQSLMRKEVLECLNVLPIEQIYITHHHEDHTGNLNALQQKLNCPAYASTSCVELMKKPPNISFAQHISWGKRPPNFNLLPKNDFIATPNYRFQIIPIPGHAKDMVALYEANEGWLFSADLWVYDYIRYFMYSESMSEQMESLKRVLALDFDVLLCSHNPQFRRVKQRLQNKLDFFENFYTQVARLHHEGHSIRSIFKEMKLKRTWHIRILSGGTLSTKNMIKSVIRDENQKSKTA